MAASLDRANISNGKAFHILSRAPGIDKNCALSKSTIRRKRIINREQTYKKTKATLQFSSPLVVHWDAKTMSSTENPKINAHRLSVVVTTAGEEQILGVPEVTSGKGVTEAEAVEEILKDWKLENDVVGMCYDTTFSNSGIYAGACTILEQKLNRTLYGFACRHHVYELIPAAIYDHLFGPSNGPIIPLFQRFQKAWPGINRKNFKSALDDPELASFIKPFQHEVLSFASKQLSDFQPRDNYRELLNLVHVFLSGKEKQVGTLSEVIRSCPWLVGKRFK